MENKRRTLGENENFINMLLSACEDDNINKSLELLLTLPDSKRKEGIRNITIYLKGKGAPGILIEAFECLNDNEVAEKAYEFIYQCKR